MEMRFIVDDYLRSNEFFNRKAGKILRILKILSLGLLPVENLMLTFTAKEEFLVTSFGTITNLMEMRIEGRG